MKTVKKVFSVLLILCVISSLSALAAAADGSAEQHTITFDVQGIGETPDPITVNDGECYYYLSENNPDNPTADGYVFNCWVTTLDFEPDEVEMANHAAYLETPIYEDMTLYAVWDKIVDRIDITVDPPVAGDVIGTKRYETEDYSFDYQYPRPNAAVTSEGSAIHINSWDSTLPDAYWLSDPDDIESVFYGTFEDGKEYGISAQIRPLFGYRFSDILTVTVNGETLPGPVYSDYYNLCNISAPIMCGEKQPGNTDPTHAVITHKSRKATRDEATADQSSSSGTTNTSAVQTGGGNGFAVVLLLIAALAAVAVLRRKNGISQ